MRNQAHILLKRSCTLGTLVNTQTKGIKLLCIGKNNICISCVLMALSIYCIRATKPLVKLSGYALAHLLYVHT